MVYFEITIESLSFRLYTLWRFSIICREQLLRVLGLIISITEDHDRVSICRCSVLFDTKLESDPVAFKADIVKLVIHH